MKTTHLPKEKVIRYWHLFDAKDQILGRLATKIAVLLIGKHKVTYSPHLDGGDCVVVINAQDIVTTGKKEKQKIYRHYSGFPGGLRELTLEQLREKDPTRLITLAVRGMLPKNRLRDRRLARLKVFAGDQHPYGDKLKKANA